MFRTKAAQVTVYLAVYSLHEIVSARRPSQRELPRLPDQLGAEAAVRFLFDQHEAGLLIDVSRLYKHVVGPQHEFLVSLAPCEPDALVHEAFAQSQSAGPRVDEQPMTRRRGQRPSFRPSSMTSTPVNM